jgi:hypothetical protein
VFAVATSATFAVAACSGDARVGATREDAGTTDAAAGDAVAPSDGGADSAAEAQVPDAGDDATSACWAQWQTMLTAPMKPPFQYAGLDLSKGQDPRGLRADEADAIEGCGTEVPGISRPGFRELAWGTNRDVEAFYNLDSRVIHELDLLGATMGAAVARGPDGSTYTVRLGTITDAPADGGPPLPVSFDWTQRPNAQLDSLYDALVDTFDPGVGLAADCQAAGMCVIELDDGAGASEFGVRPLNLFMHTPIGSIDVQDFAVFNDGGTPDCTTPNARAEVVEYDRIVPPTHIAGLDLDDPGADAGPPGLTLARAQAIDCAGDSAPASPGYSGIAYNAGDVVADFNATSGVVHTVEVTGGWKGDLVFEDAAHASRYSVTLTGIRKNGQPFAVDWGSPAASLTELFDAMSSTYLPPTTGDTDCTASPAGTPDCVVAAAGAGLVAVTFPRLDLGMTFESATGALTEMHLVWPAGT